MREHLKPGAKPVLNPIGREIEKSRKKKDPGNAFDGKGFLAYSYIKVD
jgi:hypothetical protein